MRLLLHRHTCPPEAGQFHLRRLVQRSHAENRGWRPESLRHPARHRHTPLRIQQRSRSHQREAQPHHDLALSVLRREPRRLPGQFHLQRPTQEHHHSHRSGLGNRGANGGHRR